jgi:glycosyltransferase involved in cell wall biosynthesis
MRILGLTNFLPPLHYGYGAICADAMGELAARGHHVEVLVAAGGQDLPFDVRHELDHVPAAWRRPVAGVRAELRSERAARAALSRGVDVAIAWHMRGIPKGTLTLLHGAGVPVIYMLGDLWVVYERPGPPSWWRVWQIADRIALYRAARTAIGRGAGLGRLRLDPPPIAEEGICAFASRWLQQRYAHAGFEPARAHVVPNGIRLEHRDGGPRRPLDDRDLHVLFAGRADDTKGADVAVAAIEQVPGAHLTVAGEGPYAVSGERVTSLGLVSRERVADLMRAADVFVMPGRIEEAFGLVYIEAMAAGAAVVGTATGGAAELVQDGGNGLVVEPGDAGALAAAIVRLRDDDALRARLSDAGRTTARRFGLDRMADALEALAASATPISAVRRRRAAARPS